ncbi:MAG: hypothetical protein LEGION0398_MBIBDBAK_00270 [Legionellaceae bacterium]
MLLKLWSEFQKNNIPLVYRNIQGDKKILGPSNLPTPFSITSETKSKEWNGKHGILFKQFSGFDKRHTILKVTLKQEDLINYQIEFNPKEIAKKNSAYFIEHQNKALEYLQCDIEQIKTQSYKYIDKLNDASLIENIQKKIESYQTKLKGTDIEEREELQKKIFKEIQDDSDLQFIFNCYPRQTDSNFSYNENISNFIGNNFCALANDIIDNNIVSLRQNYETKLKEIKSDFETTKIDWSRYISGYSEDLCQELIEKNPAQMQCIYRRMVLLEQEKNLHAQFKKQWLKATYGNDKSYKELTEFSQTIDSLKKNNKIDSHVLKKFEELYEKVEDNLFSTQKRNIDNTPYFIVMRHFTQIAQKINNGKQYTIDEIDSFAKKLTKKLNKKPMNRALKLAILGVIGAVIGALIGAAIGFTIGAVVTFWGCGFGALPAAIAAGLLGATFVQAIAITSTTLGGSLLFGSVGISLAAVGFFNTKQNCDKETIQSEINHVYDSLKPVSSP